MSRGFAVEVDRSERALVGAGDLGDAAHDGVGVIRSVVAAGIRLLASRSSGVDHQMYLQLEDRTVVRPASFTRSLESGDDLALDVFGEGADVDAPAAGVGGGLEGCRKREGAGGGDWPRWSREAAQDTVDGDVHGVNKGEVRATA